MSLRHCWIAASLLAAPAPAAEPVDYARDIKPIFAAHCASCHGPTKQKSDLRLDLYARIKQGGNSGPAVVPNKSADSLLIQAVTGSKPDVTKMPPKGAVSPEQIALLKRWIDEGAKGPAKDEAAGGAAASTHWSFQPVKQPDLPATKNPCWARNGIDRFILARLEKDGIAPSAEADKVTLIRRVTLDLTGLLPTLAEVDAFLADTSASAYEALVERLLKSPHYGEHQARLWLDAARYADSNGFTIDAPRSIWKYRDWVINAFNRDLPFDQFTIQQLAGDLLPKPTTEILVATGFHRNTMINQEGGIDLEQFRVESVVDRVNTTGSVWLGLTVGCAQCHDHKFDPFSQREYYQLLAFFNNCDEPTLEILSPADEARRKQVREALSAVEKQLERLDPTSEAAIEKWERTVTDETRHLVPKKVADIFLVAPAGRNAKQKQALEAAYRANDLTRHVVGGLTTPLGAVLNAEVLLVRNTLQKERDRLVKQEPAAVTTMVVRERKAPRETHVMLGGDFTRKGAKVAPGFPAVVPAQRQAGNRLDLARWLVDPANPLTARVAVNRWWGQFFGTGIVETENDFGTQGTPPSHPQLLDWLASEFVARGWSVKAMQRLIVTSAAYRQSSKARPELERIDARNRLLARQSRLRVNAEVVRDVALAASGLLSEKVGGPSVFPPQPDGVYKFTQVDKAWKPSPGEDQYRRGMYTYFWRSAPHPQLVTFDAPDASVTCTRRNRSNTPLQALTLLNDAGFYEYAQGLAARIDRGATMDDTAKLRHAFRLCVAREPTDRELGRLQAFLARQQSELAGKPEEAKKLSPSAPDRAPWVMLARVLLNLDEFITRE
ncbi:MAG TPA: PSD1 and planctomycete cytochrome C domain-containing protein [Gemmataceae bacterium]|nr:PSD1 and planctomycete cytochrome C domain-containing protein [Gemmataceae bacterium]